MITREYRVIIDLIKAMQPTVRIVVYQGVIYVDGIPLNEKSR